MTKDKYTFPNPVDLGSKTAQIDSMTDYRNQSRVSNKSIKDISSQVQNLMRENGDSHTLSHVNNVDEEEGSMPVYDEEESDEEEVETVTSYAFKRKRAEETIER